MAIPPRPTWRNPDPAICASDHAVGFFVSAGPVRSWVDHMRDASLLGLISIFLSWGSASGWRPPSERKEGACRHSRQPGPASNMHLHNDAFAQGHPLKTWQ